MPLPLLPQQDFYIAHRILPADYAMPALEAANDHYGMGYIISGDRFVITPKQSYYHRKGELGIMPPYVYHKTMPLAPEANIPYEGILIKFSPKFVEPFTVCVGQSVFEATKLVEGDCLCHISSPFYELSYNLLFVL